MQEFGVFFIYTALSVLFAVSMLICSLLVAPKTKNEVKNQIYECGIMPEKFNRQYKFKIQFLTYAVIFLIFDIETIFLFPFAVDFDALGIFAFTEIMIFTGLLLFGLIYVIKKKVVRFK